MLVPFVPLVMRVVILGLPLATFSPALANAEEEAIEIVRAGKQVSFEYTLRLDDQIGC